MPLGLVLPASVDSASAGTQTAYVNNATAEDPVTAVAQCQHQTVQVAKPPSPVHVTSATQTEGHPSGCRTQPAAHAQVTKAVQTEGEADKQLLLAQQGRLPLTKASFRTCQEVASLIHSAAMKARDGNVLAAERELCQVRP